MEFGFTFGFGASLSEAGVEIRFLQILVKKMTGETPEVRSDKKTMNALKT